MNPNELIDALGGTTAVSRLLGIKAPSVHAWRTGGIPNDKLIRLAPVAEQRGISCRRDLSPDDWHLIWPELADASSIPPAPLISKSEREAALRWLTASARHRAISMPYEFAPRHLPCLLHLFQAQKWRGRWAALQFHSTHFVLWDDA